MLFCDSMCLPTGDLQEPSCVSFFDPIPLLICADSCAYLLRLHISGSCLSMACLLAIAYMRFVYLPAASPHCRFMFEHGMLTCDSMPRPTDTPAGTLASKLLIERVIILGLPADKAYTARSSGGKTHAVISGTGVDVRLAKGAAVVVRAVNLPLASDWSLRITEGAPQVAAE
jgi:hypothetical protein